MTFERTMIWDRAANFTGAIALLSGLFIGAAMFIIQSM